MNKCSVMSVVLAQVSCDMLCWLFRLSAFHLIISKLNRASATITERPLNWYGACDDG